MTEWKMEESKGALHTKSECSRRTIVVGCDSDSRTGRFESWNASLDVAEVVAVRGW